MRKGNGGIIGPLNTPSQAVAGGMWSMDEQQQNLGARNWPGTPAATKPNSPTFANSCTFTASISDSTMTVSAISSGTLAVGQVISGGTTGNFVTQYTIITAQLTGTTGLTGTYTVSKGQTVTSTSMSSSVVITSITAPTSSVQIPFITGYDGGSPITAITARVYLGGSQVGTASGTTSPLTVTGLANSAVYSVTLTATNAIGTSAASTGPYFQTPSAPAAPTIGTATLVGVAASVTFTAPTSNNGSAITSYTVTSSPGGLTGTGSSSPITVSGLSGSTTYTFSVTATNAIGTSVSSAASNSITTPTLASISYLIVGGGGGGLGGGAGGGGVLSGTYSAVPTTSYSVVVGTGGVGTTLSSTPLAAQTGGNSSVFGLTASGGGWGGKVGTNGGDGGSGGGAGPSGSTVFAGGTPVSGQGFTGGANVAANPFAAGGGGGAGGVGSNASSGFIAGNGGVGVSNSITGTATYYAGGGGGGVYNGSDYGAATGGTGGLGGGGNGGYSRDINNGTAGTDYLGGGGGGGTNFGTGANGGIGVVILLSTTAAASTTGSPTLTRPAGAYCYTFTGSGSITY